MAYFLENDIALRLGDEIHINGRETPFYRRNLVVVDGRYYPLDAQFITKGLREDNTTQIGGKLYNMPESIEVKEALPLADLLESFEDN